MLFNCHRSGHAELKEEKRIALSREVFFQTHVGNQIDKGPCNLSNNARVRIASLLMADMKESRIMEIFKEKDDGDRSYWLKSKDIQNIKDFCLNTFDKKHSVDAKSVDLIVSKWADDVIAYKPCKQVPTNLHKLDESDFFLALMFPFQMQLAELVK